MFDSVVLDIVIGLIFVYLLYSLLATIIQEIIATNFGFRAKVLEKAVMRMLDDGDTVKSRLKGFIGLFLRKKNQPKFTALFYSHPLIKYLAPDKWHSKPAYLSAQNFSKVVVDLLRGKQLEAAKDYKANIQAALSAKKTNWGDTEINKDTGDFLDSIWVDAQGDIDEFRVNLEHWYNETMERASGWYKQYTQVILLCVGMAIAVLFNVDTIQIVHKLEKDPNLREQLVTQADAFAKAHPNLSEELSEEKRKNETQIASMRDTTRKGNVDSLNRIAEAKYDTLKVRRDTLFSQATRLVQNDISKINNALALGWGNYDGAEGFFAKATYVLVSAFGSWTKLLGLFLTAIAISLGAPFWFDTLNKLIKMRGAIKGVHSGEKHKDPNATVEVVNVKRDS